MNILVTLDKNYLPPLRVMLGSMFLNNKGTAFDIYVISNDLDQKDMEGLSILCQDNGSRLHSVRIENNTFDGAPTIRYYTKAMYYRLLAADLLPEELDRILYIDPDTLIINSLADIYSTDFKGNLFAAASHSGLLGVSDYVNRIRLSAYEAEGYFNSGVLLMNLTAMRSQVKAQDIFAYAKKNKKQLILPDQDILNALYGHKTLAMDDSIWNYDARYFEGYWLGSQGSKDMDWVMDNTVILHFCGKNKPWSKDYVGFFSALYKHYQRLLGEK
jgi:lipopolysaccharide biosynthesis glycosyltransferase